jgi:hypothetical protein
MFTGVIAAALGTTGSAQGPGVTIINTPDQPVPVTGSVTIPAGVVATIAPVRMPFHQDVSVSVPAGTPQSSVTFAVPAGYRLVIEYASGSTRVSDKELVRVNISTDVAGVFAQHTLANQLYRRDFADPATSDDFIVTWGQPVRIYADPGSNVRVTATRSENAEITPTFFQLAVSGYLEACGSAPGCPIS